MRARKRKANGEPLLNTVARSLGHAAGTLARATQELTENLSAVGESVTPEKGAAKVRKSARVGRLRSRTRRPKKRIRRIIRKRAAADSKSGKLPKSKSARSGPKATGLKK
jgi:hypothetical protein